VLFRSRAMQPVAGNDNSFSKDPTTPSPAPVAAAQQGNITSLPATSQPTNSISTQTNQLSTKSSQKSADSQNELVIPLLITAVVAYVIVVMLVLTYKSNLNVSKKTEN
jgi:hypothetical protein